MPQTSRYTQTQLRAASLQIHSALEKEAELGGSDAFLHVGRGAAAQVVADACDGRACFRVQAAVARGGRLRRGEAARAARESTKSAARHGSAGREHKLETCQMHC